MSKAYDRVEWNFLESRFLRLGFDTKWVNWVMFCVRSVTYSVIMNGNSYGYIKPTRGLRQGDPLSPFLFILCAEGLVHIMNKAEQEGRISGIRLSSSCPSVQHLLFADDSLFTCRATFAEGKEILNCLKLYGESSGQEINFQKSSITFGERIDPVMGHVLGSFMSISQQGGTGKYLGLPECFSGSKRQLLSYITDKLTSRLSGWYAQTLSLGGKKILLKSVAMALPVYAMSCFRLTKFQCQKITSAMSNFWWNSCEDKKKMHWVSWEKMCKPKDKGGLGFRDIADFNQALLAKQAWRLLSNPNSLLARVYTARYFPRVTFMDAVIGYRPSYAWRSIIHGRDLLAKGLMKSIGNGISTRVWLDNWILDGTPRRPFQKETFIDLNLQVSSLISADGKWNVSRLNELFFPGDVTRIVSSPPASNLQDSFFWAYSKDGNYSVKSGNKLLEKTCPEQSMESPDSLECNRLKSRIWGLQTIPKIKMFLWRCLSGALAVKECLIAHGLQAPGNCSRCHSALESITHVLFHCFPAKRVWEISLLPLPLSGFSDSLLENLDYILFSSMGGCSAATPSLAIPWIIWGIWKNRNEFIFEQKQGDLNLLISFAIEEASIWYAQLQADAQSVVLRGHSLIVKETRWTKPAQDWIKCNVHSSWCNDRTFNGGAWIARDYTGAAIFHARDAFTPSVNRIYSELGCVLWALTSLKDLHIENVEVWSDCSAAVEALLNPHQWPKYRSLLNKVLVAGNSFKKVSFHLSSSKANSVAREIAKSVTRDGRLRSYLSIGGPAWLHNRIEDDRRS